MTKEQLLARRQILQSDYANAEKLLADARKVLNDQSRVLEALNGALQENLYWINQNAKEAILEGPEQKVNGRLVEDGIGLGACGQLKEG